MRRLPPLRPALEQFGEALWLRPAVAIAGALLAGWLLSAVQLQPGRLLLFSEDADAARDVLLSTATVTLTVTATVFGFIIVALQLASTQYSPRSLRTFVRDTTTQNSLALFMAVVAYCTIVLVRTGDGDEQAPGLAVTVGLALVLAVVVNLAVLIHHTAQSVRVEHLMQAITHDTLAAIARQRGQETIHPEEHAEGLRPPADARTIRAPRSGYVQDVDIDAIARAVTEHDLTLAFDHAVGDHVIEGLPLAHLWASGGERVGDATVEAISGRVAAAVSVGIERTMSQDVAFGPRQLVDIGLRAISPAINDPRTAVEAVLGLSRVMCALCGVQLGDSIHRSADGSPRVILRGLTFAHHLGLACDQLRRFGGGEPSISVALLDLLDALVICGLDPERHRDVARHVDLIEEAARADVVQPADLAAVTNRAEEVRHHLAAPRTIG